MFEVVAQGEGPLFMDPNADKAREFFRQKNRALISKVMSVKEAVQKFVQDGNYLGIGGFGANRIPTAVCHEIVRQKKKNLTFAGHTSTHDFQILAAGEVFNRCDIAYIIGLEARGLSPNARRYMESGKVQSCEWTNYGMALRFKAAAMGVSFLPGRNMMGTDTFKYSAAKVVKCPFTGQLYCLYPALWPDVSAIHVHEADIYGNCRTKGIIHRRFRARPGLEAPDHHLRAAGPQRCDPERPHPHGHSLLPRRRRLRSSLRQLPREYALRVFFRRDPSEALDGVGEGSGTIQKVPEPVRFMAEGFQ